MQKIPALLQSVINWLFIVITAYLFHLNIHCRALFDHVNFQEFISIEERRPFKAFAGLCVMALILILLKKVISLVHDRYFRNTRVHPFLILALCLFAIAGFRWIREYTYFPVADQAYVWNTACEIAEGSRSLGNVDYYRIYPHQKYMAFMYSFLAMFNPDFRKSVLPVNLIASVFSFAGIVYLARLLNRKNESDSQTVIRSSLLVLIFIPLLLYMTYVYGNVIAMPLILWSFIFLIRACRDFRWHDAILCALFAAFAVMFYQSAKITCIAEIMVVLLYILLNQDAARKNVKKLLILCLLIPLSVFSVQRGIDQWYAVHTDLPQSEGVPAEGYVLMGITSYGISGPGSYDGSNIQAYVDNGMVNSITKQQLQQQIRTAVEEYRTGVRDKKFFREKTISQWCDPWFNSLTMTVYLWDTSKPVPSGMQTFLESSRFSRTEDILTVFSSLVYLLACIYALQQSALGKYMNPSLQDRNDPHSIASLLPKIYFIGGFIFQFVWESKARYCLPYFLALLPLAAMGLGVLEENLSIEARSAVFLSERKEPILKDQEYGMVDVGMVVMAVMVIVIHTMPFSISSEWYGKIFYIFMWQCNAFFMVSSGYFLSRRLSWNDPVHDKEVIHAKIRHMSRLYLVWNIIYLPLELNWYRMNGGTFTASLQDYLTRLVFVGNHNCSWQLWYLLSVIYAFLILSVIFRRKASPWALLLMILCSYQLYNMGNYYAYVTPATAAQTTLNSLVLNTIQNGRIFQAGIYIPLGILLERYPLKHKQIYPLFLFIAFAAKMKDFSLTSYGSLFYDILMVSGLFLCCALVHTASSAKYKRMRKISKLVFLIHMFVYTVYYLLHYGQMAYGIDCFIMTTAISMILAFVYTRKLRRSENLIL